MRLPLSFAALFLSVILLQISSGGVGPLDAISGITLGFSTAQIGLLGSAHFIGFFVGCWWAPRLIGSVGHARAFSAFTTLGAIGLLAHMLVTDPTAWSIMRMATGLCVAGCYTVIEAWLQAEVTNETRGRAMGLYRIADMGASLVAQLLIGVLTPASYVSYNLLAILCCAALLPIALTKRPQPETPSAPRLRPMLAVTRSPLAAAGVVVAALSSASFRMVGPVYGQGVGLALDQIALFMAAFVAGGALAQYPVGWLADKYDRRWVLIWLSVAAIASCVLTATLTDLSTTGIFITAMIFGLTTFPIYSVAAAHAHDFATSDERVELSAALMFWYATGAIAAPYLASVLMTAFGPPALFAMIAVGHAVLVIFGIIRTRVRPTQAKTPYVYAPRTSFLIGRLMKSSRDRD
ncbi:MFS transporter [Marivita hallyeonensis]|uniref:Predicted arabinose efflux permease, MFS family n=1 Tax=Marivita hallyeonensis TaxID=996342 RepID=A0A1M5X016_9RHOB|nr:MFS transporter [Marivita hallyeonensis]SHH93256.1 Predicted arabinose efflux permease, MFS family [Marivita hallyeonensis]